MGIIFSMRCANLLTNGKKIIAFIRLNDVWKAARNVGSSALSASPVIVKMSPLVIVLTKVISGLKKMIASMLPTTLKRIWAVAALRALVLVPMEAIYAVIVVPMFCPRQRAAAAHTPIHPW